MSGPASRSPQEGRYAINTIKFLRLSVIIILSSLCILTGFNIKYAEARREIVESGKELKGIAFDEFWEKCRRKGKSGPETNYI